MDTGFASAVSDLARRRVWLVAAPLLAGLGLIGCSEPQADYAVRGAALLARGEASDETVYDIIAYPMDADELAYFLANIDPFLTAVEPHEASWLAVQAMPDPTRSMRDHPVWRASGIRCEDFMAAYAKMDFMSGYFASEPLRPEELDQTIARLERSLESEADPELVEAVAQMRQLARIAPLYGESQERFYRANAAEIERALHRFRSVGSGEAEPPFL